MLATDLFQGPTLKDSACNGVQPMHGAQTGQVSAIIKAAGARSPQQKREHKGSNQHLVEVGDWADMEGLDAPGALELAEFAVHAHIGAHLQLRRLLRLLRV